MTTAQTQEKAAKTNDAAKSRAEAAGIDTSGWNSASLEIQGWAMPEISKRIVGRAVEAIQVEGEFGLQDVVKVRLGLPCEAVTGSGDEQKTVLLQTGDVVAVRISAQLQTLLRCVQNECAVEIIPKGSKKLKGNKRMWMYGFKYLGLLAQPVMGNPAPVSGNGGDGDDLPF